MTVSLVKSPPAFSRAKCLTRAASSRAKGWTVSLHADFIPVFAHLPSSVCIGRIDWSGPQILPLIRHGRTFLSMHRDSLEVLKSSKFICNQIRLWRCGIAWVRSTVETKIIRVDRCMFVYCRIHFTWTKMDKHKKFQVQISCLNSCHATKQNLESGERLALGSFQSVWQF